jgi:hypothetical protein
MFDERSGRHRPAQQIALRRIATEAVEHRELCFGLDTFGNHSDAEAVRQAMVALTIAVSFSSRPETVGEGAVDLEHVDGERLRYASDEKPVPKSSSARPMPASCSWRKRATGLRSIVDQRSFGELEIDARRRKPCSEFVEDELREAGVAELTG